MVEFSTKCFKPYTKSDSFEEYLSVNYVSSSDLPQLAISPLHYKLNKEKPKKETDSQRLGTALHKLVLEPGSFISTYKLFDESERPFPDKDYKTKANKDWKDNYAAESLKQGFIALTHKEWDDVHGMAESLLNTTRLPDLIGDSTKEQSHYLYNERFNLPIKIRPDLISNSAPFYLSLKTTVDASPRGFGYQCDKYGYHYKEAFYFDHLNQFYKGEREIKRIVIAAVENTPPYYAAIYYLDANDLETAQYTYKVYLQRLRNALDTNVWRGYDYYSEDNSGIMPLRLPYSSTIVPER